MDRGIWATWYDLPEEAQEEYLTWLHAVHIPAMLARPGYLWAAHVQNIMTPERQQNLSRRLIHVDDPAVPTGNAFLLLDGAESPHTLPPIPLAWGCGSGLQHSPVRRTFIPTRTHPTPKEGPGGGPRRQRSLLGALYLETPALACGFITTTPREVYKRTLMNPSTLIVTRRAN
jgi:hypothetical protein